ncbi:uncharacterized protein BDZ99DRAFT_467234, partial [Mytilinidion resinicola]
MNSPTFIRLEAARKKVVEPAMCINFDHLLIPFQEDAAQAFYNITKQIAEEMQAKTSALTPEDLGGFTWGTLEYKPDAIAYSITLPPGIGGYKNWFTLPAEYVKFMDITMLASKFGVGTIPTCSPDYSLFHAERPFRSEHRREFERMRLTTSQLILSMQRIILGRIIAVLLRRPDAWDI